MLFVHFSCFSILFYFHFLLHRSFVSSEKEKSDEEETPEVAAAPVEELEVAAPSAVKLVPSHLIRQEVRIVLNFFVIYQWIFFFFFRWMKTFFFCRFQWSLTLTLKTRTTSSCVPNTPRTSSTTSNVERWFTFSFSFRIETYFHVLIFSLFFPQEKFVLDNYMHKQPTLSTEMRAILVDWLVEVQVSSVQLMFIQVGSVSTTPNYVWPNMLLTWHVTLPYVSPLVAAAPPAGELWALPWDPLPGCEADRSVSVPDCDPKRDAAATGLHLHAHCLQTRGGWSLQRPESDWRSWKHDHTVFMDHTVIGEVWHPAGSDCPYKHLNT